MPIASRLQGLCMFYTIIYNSMQVYYLYFLSLCYCKCSRNEQEHGSYPTSDSWT